MVPAVGRAGGRGKVDHAHVPRCEHVRLTARDATERALLRHAAARRSLRITSLKKAVSGAKANGM